MPQVKFATILALLLVPLIAQEVTIDWEVKMLALGDFYTIGQSVDINERWPHQFHAQL
jgi:hypothetical protein